MKDNDIWETDELDDGAQSLTLVCGPDVQKMRIDTFITERTDLTRSAAQRLLGAGEVLWNQRIARKSDHVFAGDTVIVTIPAPLPSVALPENIPLHIVYEDDDIIVVNKPSGMVVHPAPGHPSGTLVNALLHHCMTGNGRSTLSGIGGVVRPGIVHRIDRDTSGLLVVAKNDVAHEFLTAEIKKHAVARIYCAIVIGKLPAVSGTIDAPIGRNPTDRKKMAVVREAVQSSRPAVTHYTVLKQYYGFTLVRLALETGRTHQIRVHLSSIGHPVLGDPLYGGASTPFQKRHPTLISGQCLHAAELHLLHPKTKLPLTFRVPMPAAMEKVCELLNGDEG